MPRLVSPVWLWLCLPLPSLPERPFSGEAGSAGWCRFTPCSPLLGRKCSSFCKHEVQAPWLERTHSNAHALHCASEDAGQQEPGCVGPARAGEPASWPSTLGRGSFGPATNSFPFSISSPKYPPEESDQLCPLEPAVCRGPFRRQFPSEGVWASQGWPTQCGRLRWRAPSVQ